MPPLPIPYCRVASHRRSTNHVTCSSVPFDTSGLCNSRLKTSVPLGRGAPRVGNNERRRATGRDLRSFYHRPGVRDRSLLGRLKVADALHLARSLALEICAMKGRTLLLAE
jgi:hypothetical protein